MLPLLEVWLGAQWCTFKSTCTLLRQWVIFNHVQLILKVFQRNKPSTCEDAQQDSHSMLIITCICIHIYIYIYVYIYTIIYILYVCIYIYVYVAFGLPNLGFTAVLLLLIQHGFLFHDLLSTLPEVGGRQRRPLWALSGYIWSTQFGWQARIPAGRFQVCFGYPDRLLGRLASNLGSPAVFAALGDQSFPQHPPSFGSGGERFQEKPQSRYRPAASLRNPSPSSDPRVGSVCASRDQDQKRRRREDSRDSERSVIPRRRRNSPLSWKPSLREPATKPLHLRPAKAPVVVPPRAIVHKEADYSTARQPPYHNSSKAPSRRPPSPPPKPTHPPQSKGSGGKSKGKARSPFQGKGQNIWAWTPSEPSWAGQRPRSPKRTGAWKGSSGGTRKSKHLRKATRPLSLFPQLQLASLTLHLTRRLVLRRFRTRILLQLHLTRTRQD